MDKQDPSITAARVALDKAKAAFQAAVVELERVQSLQPASALGDATLAREYLDANRGDVEGGQRGVHPRGLGYEEILPHWKSI